MKAGFLLLILVVAPESPLFAWGEKGHLMTSEAATSGVPAEMPLFFHHAYPELIYEGYDPDRWRGAGKSLEAMNPPDHFLDYEYVAGLQLPRSRYDYIAMLYSSGVLQRHGIALDTAGFLPWRIAELSDLLSVESRLWILNHDPGERRQIEQSIIVAAGLLGHFVADASNPHHTTYNYNGWTDPNPGGYATDCETHFRFETEFVSRAIEVADIEHDLAGPTLRQDYFAAGLDLIRESNSLVGRLYQIDRDGGFSTWRGTPDARKFTISRLAAGASLLRDLWWSTYRNALERVERAHHPGLE